MPSARTGTGIAAQLRVRRQNERVGLSGKLLDQTTGTTIDSPIVLPLATGVGIAGLGRIAI